MSRSPLIVVKGRKPSKISQSNTPVDEQERRLVAVNKYRPPIAPLKVNKAELMLEKLHRANPVKNIVSRVMPLPEGAPVDPNYALYIELDRLATASVPKQPLQPLKSKSPFTEAMIDKYKQEEERNIMEAKRAGNYVDFISPPESMKPELEEPVEFEYEDDYDDYIQLRLRLQREYKQTQDEIERLNAYMRANPRFRNEPAVIVTMENLSRRLNGLQNNMDGIAEDIENLNQLKRDTDAENMRIKKKNAIELKNYEDMYKLLNKSLPIQQMVGETDAEYRERLINFKQETSNIADENEARTYEHKVFQRNLKRIINLPVYQVENLIKELDGMMATEKGQETAERVFQLNEIWPKVEAEFVKRYGKDPLLRNPIQTLYDFFIQVLSGPLVAEAPEAFAQVMEAQAQNEGVASGEIEAVLLKLNKADILELLKEAGIAKKGANLAEFGRKKVFELKKIYTEHMRQPEYQPTPLLEKYVDFLDRRARGEV
jgi:hypothetical protein